MIRNTTMLRERWAKYSSIVLPILPGLVVIALQSFGRPEPFDDAFITFRYARNIAEGLGFVYNTGERVLGTTTPLFTLFLALVGWITDTSLIPRASFVISIIADFLAAIFLFRITRWIFQSSSVALLAALAFVLFPLRLTVAQGGMETSLYIALLLISYERALAAKRTLIAAVFAALALLTRPDAAIALVPLYAWMYLTDHKTALKATALTVALIAPWFIWATQYFGSPIPQSLLAKSIAYRNPAGFAAFFLVTFLGTGTLGPYPGTLAILSASALSFILIILGNILLGKNQPAALPITLYPLLYMIFMTVTNAPMYFPWYYPPLVPGLIVAVIACVWFLPIPSIRVRQSLLILISAIIILVPAMLMRNYPSWTISREREAAYQIVCSELAPRNGSITTVLAPDIGVLGWCLGSANIIDPIGLVSPGVIPYLADLPAGQFVSARLISDTEPEYVIALEQYVRPFITDSTDFKRDYNQLYQTPVSIAGKSQYLYVFGRNSKTKP